VTRPAWWRPLGAGAWPRRTVAWAGSLFIAVIVALAAYDIVRGYHATVERIGRELDSQARVIAEQTARSVQAVDVVLQHLKEQMQTGPLAALSPADLHRYLQEKAVGLVQADALVVFGADAHVRAASALPPQQLGPLLAAAQTPFERLRAAGAGEFVIGHVMRNPATGRWVVPLGRPLRTAEGEFAGAVGAAGRVEYFQDFYRDAFPEPGARVALLHRDSTLIARHPPAEAALGQRFPVVEDMLRRAAEGETFSRTISPVDGADRFGSIRAVPDYPLVVVVTRDAKTALAPWRAQALGSVWRTLALAAASTLLLAVVLRQLTRLAAAHASLAESQERYALAAAGADDGIWDWDMLAGRVYNSQRGRTLFGVPDAPELMQMEDWFALIRRQLHPDDLARREAALRAHLDGATPAYEIEFRVHDAAGDFHWLRVHGMCVRSTDGRPLRIAGSVSDIDARKRAEQALRRSEERYQLAVDGSNEGLWDWDLEGDLLFLSPRAQRLVLASAGEPLRPRREWLVRIAYHPDDLPQVRRAIAAHLRGATPHFAVEYRLRHHDGDWHWYRQRGVAVRDARGHAYRMAGSMEDISARKHAEAQRDRLELQLRQAQKLEAIGTLAGGIAHDFNNILSAILGYGELAQKDAPAGSAQRRHLDAALAAGARAKSLVERILAFSRSGMGERVPVHVGSVVVEALDAIGTALPPGVTLTRRLEAGDAGLLGDPTQIHQVVMNLCANAVQAMKSAGTIEVGLDRAVLEQPLVVSTSTLPAGAYLRLVVRDSGQGIAPEVLERIFDPFFTTKQVGVGTGLGLSLVHGIVTDLGGGIAVESRLGAGAAFTVYLPSTGEVAAPVPAQHSVPPGNGETILLVDDEEPLVRLGEEMLAELGYEPVGYTSSVQALEAFRAEPGRFDAVLSDEAMPGMTGSELVLQLRGLHATIPIVLMSGFVSPALLARAREAGVAEVLGKPLAARDIARALAAALQRGSEARTSVPSGP
jgi:PAS domain S-box-containing protein